MDINFEYYKIFYYVAKYENITKAAVALGSNQPNVTRILKLLESQLNCKLFNRGPRGVSLTKEGELLYSHVEVACRRLLAAQEELYPQDTLRSGTVEIGATETALHLFLLHVLQDFKQKHPGVKIKIHNHTAPETVRQLVNGKLDFAVITTPCEIPKTFSSMDILSFQEILVGGTQYRALGKEPLTLEKMKKYPWISLGRDSATYHFYKDFFIANQLDMEPDMEVATSDLMLPLIQNHLGIGFIPETLALPHLESGNLVRIELDCAPPKRSIRIVTDNDRRKSLAADTFYQYLTAVLS